MKRAIHVVSVSSGIDSQATLQLAIARVPRNRLRFIFCDTGNEDQAVYDHIAYLEQAFDITIDRLKADFSSEIEAKRLFIAQDRRTKREYERVPVFDADGNPVPKRDGRGNIVMRKVKRDGRIVEEPVQKTIKVGSGHLVRWTNKAKRRALGVLHTTGNPFLDLCLWKGRFPSRKAQFCTEELKRNMAVAYQVEMIAAGLRVVSWQGVRRDESHNRRDAKKIEKLGKRLWAFRPIVEWNKYRCFDLSLDAGIQPNPLYLQGMDRVGCMPCINVSKDELREISVRMPDHIDRIAEWELLVGNASKRAFSTMMADAHKAKDRRVIFADLNIRSRVEWSKTTRGGKQYDLLADLSEPAACSSSYGLCE